MTTPEPSMLFARVSGEAFFVALVDAFYKSVSGDPVLLALYPDPRDLTEPRRRLTMFLMQYWGGPTTYSDERGHPRLRQRHATYPIDESMRDRWLGHMRAALDACGVEPGIRSELEEYFLRAADHMRNI